MRYFTIFFFLVILNNFFAQNLKSGLNQVLDNNISGPENYIPQPFDVLHYDADIDFTKAPAKDMTGVCRITVLWKESPDSNKFYFHLRALKIDSAFYETTKVQPIETGTPSSATYHYEITPPQIAKKDTVLITIYYSGQMQAEPGSQVWGGVQSNQNILFAMGVGFYNNYVSATQHWLPCYDLPSDKATFHCRFTVKQGYTVASNGTLKIAHMLNGNDVYDWTHNYPCATYLYCFAVSNYVPLDLTDLSVDSIPIVVYSKPKDTTASKFIFRLVPRMVNTFEKRFGKYPFEKVGYVITPIGSMEHETMISYDSALVKNYYSAQDTVNIVAAHELSHQWFGDMVTCRDFRDTWLNEGFATFCESLWHEELFGFNNALDYLTSKASDYINYIANSNSQYFEGLFPIYDYPRTPPSSNYPGTIYYKGSVVLGMLRYELGDSLFFKGLLEYLNRYKFGVATTDSLRSVLEGVCGKPLDWFFNQWIYQKGWPKLSVEVDRLPSDYKGFVKLNVKINQNQIDAYGLYSNLPVEIGFKKFNGDYEYRIFKVSAKNENFDMDSIPDFTSITVNQGPHVRILADISSVITTVDETAVLNKKMIDIFPDPADSNINIYFHADMGPIKLLLTDMNGNEVFHDSINNICEEVYKINTQNFSSGTYFIVMEMPGFNERHSIRIVH